jgi:hypothetical protein
LDHPRLGRRAERHDPEELPAGDASRLLVIEQVIPPGNEPPLSGLYDLHMMVLSGGRERRADE